MKMSAKNGGKGVPLVINNLALFESDIDNEWDLLDTGSTLASSGKKQSSSSCKSDSSNKTNRSGKLNNSDFSQRLEQLAESNIIVARINLGSSIHTNILSLEAELQGYNIWHWLMTRIQGRKQSWRNKWQLLKQKFINWKPSWVDMSLLPHKAIFTSLLQIDLKGACKDRETTK
jgi:hypothetical protein